MKNRGLVAAVIVILGVLVGLPLYAQLSIQMPLPSSSNTYSMNNGSPQASPLSAPNTPATSVSNITVVVGLGVVPPRSITETMYCIGDIGTSQCPPPQNQFAENGLPVELVSAPSY